tara:strand:- start:1298 stop:2011 length:714 start_codon:yes stop_codon:yes gene_type:complete
MNQFDITYSNLLYNLYEEPIRTVGFFPGCFSPPHKGHYETAKTIGQNNSLAYVIASEQCRAPITTEQMVSVWKIYIEAMGLSNVKIKIIAGSPVTTTYQAVNLLNNGGRLVSKRTEEPSQDAAEIYNEIGKGKIEAHLYAGKEDIRGRFSAFFNEGDNIYRGKNVINIYPQGVDRVASGTETRGTIEKIAIGIEDTDTLRHLLPGPSAGKVGSDGQPLEGYLTSKQEQMVVDILLGR